ncbi:hypothetical protein BRADI_1g30523v3 [Brachypodium distachyon]|uniref:Uncharacterized protein n=1 Tax=Brachypodium distachyon TaxID=15368 RepID=A0A2K2DM48_BRADI|nr:hypothetical protein BRADI_1g30523v3 [Brachypodium distachyon]
MSRESSRQQQQQQEPPLDDTKRRDEADGERRAATVDLQINDNLRERLEKREQSKKLNSCQKLVLAIWSFINLKPEAFWALLLLNALSPNAFSYKAGNRSQYFPPTTSLQESR